jgi:hypothetical protein
MDEWSTYTPDGRPLLVRRERDTWLVRCGTGHEARSELLDVALIEAIRDNGDDAVARELAIDYGEWTRRQADQIQRDVLAKRKAS